MYAYIRVSSSIHSFRLFAAAAAFSCSGSGSGSLPASMAYPRPLGDDPLSFDEYDPTPFSGGYDQVALYGSPITPSSLTCYPITETGPHDVDHSSAPSYSFDHNRPSRPSADPPHHSDDYSSSYGRPKPGSGYGLQVEGGYGEDSGYGRPKPKPTYSDEGEHGYGRPRPPKPSYYGEEGEGFGSEEGREDDYEGRGRHHRPGYGEEGGYRPGYGEEGAYRPGYGEEGRHRPYGDEIPPPPPPTSDYEGGGFGGGYGGRSDFGSGYGDEPPPPPPNEYFEGRRHHEHGHHKHHWHHDDE